MTSGLTHATCALTHVITADELEFVSYDEISLKEAMQSCCWWMLVETLRADSEVELSAWTREHQHGCKDAGEGGSNRGFNISGS